MKVAVIGAGTIGSAVAKALSEKYEVIATRRKIEKIKWLEEYGVKITNDNRYAAKVADIVIIAVKPNKIKRVLDEIREDIKGKIVISLAAAISLETLESLADAKFVRAMPNIAVLVGESFTAYATRNLDENEIRIIEDIFKTFGMCVRVEEEYMDAITGLSGSGPAYVSVFLEALMYGGLRVGLPRDVAILASAQTLLGTAKLLLELDLHPAQIRDMVITPGGTTIDGIFELEDSRIRNALMKAVDAATKKSRILRLELEKKMK
ncbi:MAG: Pyrroline-5-carboxylate reductase [Thermococcales archaeon 44_46]|jgi:pyrroline-5-carboxylate reductase|uniref:pyrroline-5-carboxylate reductase n=1 Tax=Thermococcus sp. 101 C5 TaxID=2654197 RepID=UPI000745F3B5|nr:pyrroline-5-carboxylate reductase [Thermococcus sp. 101 C5]KUJ99836.1 MAG: Pyrroline-5-carboxylate reductase [Thermococcales archaeon 44_46]MDK2782595.1 pyrroline-5-carboxylate reductase [Thermococcaceae archaeon]MPW39362.1 pyrroline-5-carboxylate reductase [Thermococcus sp. 101 C5]HIH72184.1 pyrroline-5-carboxylate reductase [Thermococcaceae archaeon]